MKCVVCEKEKPLDDYPSMGGGRKRKKCKPCYNEAQAEYRENNRERLQGQWRTASQKHSPNHKRKPIYYRVYGLSQEDYDKILTNQGGVCAICQESKRLVIDHDHDTGIVRGIICYRCNTGLGSLGDNEAGLLRALEYLRRDNG